MDENEARRIRVNLTVGLFLIGSGATIRLAFADSVYGPLCLGVGVLFLAKSLAGIRLYGDR